MSKKGSHEIQGYFDYVVPPLEGFWLQEGIEGIDYERKEEFQWISVIRLPDFVKKANDFSSGRMHHEIYLSDASRVPQEKWRTVIRHPINKI